jgi:hypothetical protein
MEDRLGEEIPEVVRLKTFNQGGPDASAKNGWRYVKETCIRRKRLVKRDLY